MNNRPINEDEFDIELLAQKLYRVGRRALFKLSFPLRVLFRKPLRLLLCLALGVGVALLLKYTLPRTYQSDFIIRPANKGDLYFVNLLTGIGTLLHDNDYAQVAKQLKLDENTASRLSQVSMELINKSKAKDSADAALIYLRVSDPAYFDTLQASLLSYIENSEYYSKLKRLREQDILSLRERLAHDIAEMDSLKRTMGQPRAAGGFVYGEPINPVELYEEQLRLYRQQLGLNWQSTFAANFELVKKCVPSQRPYWPRLLPLLLLCVGISVVVCFIANLRMRN